MTAGVDPLHFDGGANGHQTWKFYNPALPGNPDPLSGGPQNVTGWTALLQFRTSPGASLILSLTDTTGIVVGTTDGTFTINLSSAQTLLLSNTPQCKYDLRVTSGAGDVQYLTEGPVYTRPPISTS